MNCPLSNASVRAHGRAQVIERSRERY